MPSYQIRKNNIIFNLSDIKTNFFFAKDMLPELDIYDRYQKIYPINYHRNSDILKILDSIFIHSASLKVYENNLNIKILKDTSIPVEAFPRMVLVDGKPKIQIKDTCPS